MSSRSPHELLRIAVALFVVALGAAAFAMAFRAGLQLVYGGLFHAHDVLEVFTRLPWAARLGLPALGGLLAGSVGRIAARRGDVPGLGDVMEAAVVGGNRISLRATLWKALGSWLAIATGNSVGREGPLIQFGGSLASRVAAVARIDGSPSRALVAAGTAAGFAAAYNTPFAAVLFVVEIFTGVVALESLAVILVAVTVSTALVRATVGGGPIYGQRAFSIASPYELVAYAALGVLAALFAHAFMRLLAGAERLFQKLATRQPWRAALGGLLVGVLALAVPEVAGNGYEPLNFVLDERYAMGLLLLFVLTKSVATTTSVSAGIPGGVFTPTLFVGGCLGVLWAHVLGSWFGASAAAGSFALVGMAAAIAATTHAPLMAAVLVFELSGDYAVVLPLVLATAIASLVSRAIGVDSIYAAELRRHGVRPAPPVRPPLR
jgi:chloride channel protein, CIC family